MSQQTIASDMPTREIFRLMAKAPNLVLLGLAIVYWLLTHDVAILIFLLIAELWYLVLTCNNGPLRENLSQAKARMPWLRKLKIEVGLSYLLLSLGLGLLPFTISELGVATAYQRWEVAGLLSSLFVSIPAFLLMDTSSKPWISKLMGGACVVAVVLTWFAFKSLGEGQHYDHLLFVLSIASLSLALNTGIGFLHRSERQRCWEMAIYADLPTTTALLAILYFCDSNGDTDENVAVFISGAIAFQFIWSSIVVTLIETRVSEVIHRP